MPQALTRRSFLGAAGAGLTGSSAAAAPAADAAKNVPASDRITVGMIAVGARSHQLLDAINSIEGAEAVAVCDAYQGRVERAVGRSGNRAKPYASYREILDDPSIDAVTIGTPDHLHKKHVVAALEAGKDVYCEKPLTYNIEEGLEILKAVEKSGRVLQVGSQHMSTETQKRVKEYITSGKLGQVTAIRAGYNRNTASGAWIYPIPPDASEKTVDWEMFLGDRAGKPFNLEHFFRWRCYRDYSGGISTDLFVHLCSTIHYLMDAEMPSKVMAMGQLYRWQESRDVPDNINALLEYPEGFSVNLSSTFNNQYSSEGSFLIMGTEGTIELGFGKFRFIPEQAFDNNGWIVRSWPRALEEEYYSGPEVQVNERPLTQAPILLAGGEEFRERGKSATRQHLEGFFESVRDRSQPEQNAVFGHRAAACAHLINDSAERERVAVWDFAANQQKS